MLFNRLLNMSFDNATLVDLFARVANSLTRKLVYLGDMHVARTRREEAVEEPTLDRRNEIDEARRSAGNPELDNGLPVRESELEAMARINRLRWALARWIDEHLESEPHGEAELEALLNTSSAPVNWEGHKLASANLALKNRIARTMLVSPKTHEQIRQNVRKRLDPEMQAEGFKKALERALAQAQTDAKSLHDKALERVGDVLDLIEALPDDEGMEIEDAYTSLLEEEQAEVSSQLLENIQLSLDSIQARLDAARNPNSPGLLRLQTTALDLETAQVVIKQEHRAAFGAAEDKTRAAIAARMERLNRLRKEELAANIAKSGAAALPDSPLP